MCDQDALHGQRRQPGQPREKSLPVLIVAEDVEPATRAAEHVAGDKAPDRGMKKSA